MRHVWTVTSEQCLWKSCCFHRDPKQSWRCQCYGQTMQGICRTCLALWSGLPGQGGPIPDFVLEIVFVF